MTIYWSADRVEVGIRALRASEALYFEHARQLISRYHEESFSQDYIELLIGSWMMHFLDHVYVVHQELQDEQVAVDELVDIEELRLKVYADITDYQWESESRDRNLKSLVYWLGQGKTIDEIPYDDVVAHFQGVSGVREKLKDFLRSFGAMRNSKVLISSVRLGMLDTMRLLIQLGDLVRVDRLNLYGDWEWPLDADWRYMSSREGGNPKDLSDLVCMLMPIFMPAVFLEGFQELRRTLLHKYTFVPRVVYDSYNVYSNIAFLILVAEWKKAGTVLALQQHGAGYGTEHLCALEKFETSVSDLFFTWGWKRDGANTRVLGPHFAKKKVKTSPLHRVFLNCLDMPKVIYRLQFYPSGDSAQKMHEETYSFLQTIDNRTRLCVRPYPHEYGWGFMQQLAKLVPEAEISPRDTDSIDEFMNSRLVVHSYLGTSWMETLVLNIPTVCFYDADETYRFCAEVQPFIDQLQSVGILHHSGSEAAEMVLRVFDDIEAWWMSREVQQVREAFCSQYMVVPDNYFCALEKALHDALAYADSHDLHKSSVIAQGER